MLNSNSHNAATSHSQNIQKYHLFAVSKHATVKDKLDKKFMIITTSWLEAERSLSETVQPNATNRPPETSQPSAPPISQVWARAFQRTQRQS